MLASPETMASKLEDLLRQKQAYEVFSKKAIRSEPFLVLSQNNKSYRHVLRFITHVVLFAAFLGAARYSFVLNPWLGLAVLPIYLYFQGLSIAGFMIHSHELSHNHVRSRWLNESLGIMSGLVSFINFYSFQYAHRLHHRNIGNLDAPEAGAPISLRGQERIKHEDRLHRLMSALFSQSKILWFLASWPLFIYYGDYSSWILPFRSNHLTHLKSVATFGLFLTGNCLLIYLFPREYLLLYLLPVLIGGNRILAITFMHHAHEDSVFFSEEHHNFYNTIMSTTDRNFGTLVNFFMLNNGYHIPHHLNPKIAYYDLKRASAHLQAIIPSDLKYNYYPKSRFYRDCFKGFYDQRLDRNHELYQIEFLTKDLTKKAMKAKRTR